MEAYVRFSVGETVAHIFYPELVCTVSKVIEDVTPARYDLHIPTSSPLLPLLMPNVHPMFIRPVETIHL